MEKKTCKIVITDKGISVVFTGVWNRMDLEKSRVAMYKQLPKYLVERRESLKEKETSDGRD
jgi:hypothetical protein